MSVCSLCKKTFSSNHSCGMDVLCERCQILLSAYECAKISCEEWKYSYDCFEEFDTRVDGVVSQIISDLGTSLSLTDQINSLLSKLLEMISLHLQFYTKDEVYIGMLAIRENLRHLLLKKENSQNWKLINEISTICTILWAMRFIDDGAFENNSIGKCEDGKSNLITALCLSRRYCMIKENASMMCDTVQDIQDIYYHALETATSEEYFDKYLKNGFAQKPEEYSIKCSELNDRLIAEGKTPDSILTSQQSLILKEFGFNKADYDLLIDICREVIFNRKEEPAYLDTPDFDFLESLMVIEKSELSAILDHDRLHRMLNVFSINQRIEELSFIEEAELYSFFETKNLIVFGLLDFMQNISVFEKNLLSCDYIDVFKKGISQKLITSQKKMSQYLSLSMADHLFANGYVLPMEKYKNSLIPRAEINKIKIDGKQILAECGDIDVLCLNPWKKVVLLIEVKYYKPALRAVDMLHKDRSRLEQDEVIRKMRVREQVVEKHLDEVVKFVLGEYRSGYKVKSFLLTPRPNYYAIEQVELNYLTWTEFIEKVELHQL